ncbi:MAG: hypothetical protein HUU54_08105 [Ignavibacteriaceae bacterium]|nr:hypothetical protein [Ignavibacteriaceae bacterium]
MKKIVLNLVFFAALILPQELPPGYFLKEHELYFSFANPGKTVLEKLNRMISLDKVTADSVYAYCVEDEFDEFISMGIPWQKLPRPSTLYEARMSSSVEGIMDWDTYPTYDAYVQLMLQFAEQYPSLCKLYEAGTTVQNRKIYFVKISDNAAVAEPEPDVMYSSSIHGDETTGYVLMLRLINYLLTNYGTNAEVTELVNGLEIWINPLANPDGTYRSGNTTVNGATRSNANNVDLNRNFPDPAAGPHPDGKAWQPETLTMTSFMPNINFVISGNFHGGVEVLNYPWDTWVRRHPDDAWLIYISRRYADTVHRYAPSNYLTYLNNGITNGYDWYRITGGRQDYFTYFRRGREITFEISNTKLLPASQLPAHWDYNYRSLLQYLKNALYGLRGIVTDIYGNPIKAKITVLSHDADNSEVFSDSLLGNYHRLLAAGTYTVTVSADSHITQTFNNVVIANQAATYLDLQLIPNNYVPVQLISFTAEKQAGGVLLKWLTVCEVNNKGFVIERSFDGENFESIGFLEGSGTSTTACEYSFIDEKEFQFTVYYRLKQTDFDGGFKYSEVVPVSAAEGNAEFVLLQNYPNPFVEFTNIIFSIPSKGLVSISMFNSLGEEVRRIFEGEKEQGKHYLKFGGEELAGGLYFCRLEFRASGSSEKNASAVKMIVVR